MGFYVRIEAIVGGGMRLLLLFLAVAFCNAVLFHR